MKNTSIILIGLCLILVGTRSASADISVQNTDADILGVISVMDQNEIQAAQLAEQKKVNPAVLDYARMLDRERNMHLDQAQQLSEKLGLTISDNASLEELRTNGTQDLAALTPLEGAAFAQLYMADMVKGHSEALNWIGMQDAQNEQVKRFLDQTRNQINRHLKKAQEIQDHQ